MSLWARCILLLPVLALIAIYFGVSLICEGIARLERRKDPGAP